jgi:PAS domain S-box-containing protein
MALPRVTLRDLGLLGGIAVAVLTLGWIVARDLRLSVEHTSRLQERLSQGLNLIDDMQFQAQEVRRILLYALHTSDANLQVEYADQSRASSTHLQRVLDLRSELMIARGMSTQMYAVRRAWGDFLVIRDEVIGLILEGSVAEGVALDQGQGTARFSDVRRAIAELKGAFERDASIQVREAKLRADRAIGRLTLLVVSALMASAFAAYLVSRRAALEALVRVEAHKGSILQAVPDPIISTDVEGRITELNEAAEHAFRFTRAEALGAHIEAMILPVRSHGVLAAMLTRPDHAARVVSPRIVTSGERRDGTEFPMELAAVSHTAGRDRIWTVHVGDMTERLAIEDQLRRAKDAAEVAGRAKSEFLATMSHELRTPLTSVVGIADLLQTAELPAAQRDLTRLLGSSAAALLSLVSDILDSSRIETGAMDLVPVRFSVHDCIEAALDPVTEPARRKRLDLGYLIEPDVPVEVVADHDRLRQILLNLLSNAVKYTEAGEVAVHVGTKAASGDTVTLRITVRDSGPGIPERLHHKLFQRFSRIDATAGSHHGTGLGLAISERLSRLLGGTLTVESTEGRGSAFTLLLPVHVPLVRAADPLAGSLSAVRVLTLLEPGVVGDQIRALMCRWGAIACTCDEGDTSTRSRDARFDAVVVDGEAPALRRLAETVRRRLGTPTIAIAGLQELAAPALPPFDYVIGKPIRASVLHGALSAVAAPRRNLFQAPARACAPEKFALGALAVLLVEDNDANRRVVRLMLNELEVEVDEAASGLEAVQRARGRQYDVILMDVQLPDFDGLEATRRIRSEQRGNAPIIAALTANVMQDDEVRCREAGMNGYLPKPVRLDTLAALLRPLAEGKGRP